MIDGNQKETAILTLSISALFYLEKVNIGLVYMRNFKLFDSKSFTINKLYFQFANHST